MRKVISALVLAFFAEAAALACSCIAPGPPEESQRHARAVARGAVAIVEVDVLSAHDHRLARGEQVRVRRTLFGKAPATFRVNRPAFPSSASCDLELRRGERRFLVLYDAGAAARRKRQYRIHGLCSDFLVGIPRYRAMLIEEARRRP
jgi:hypothetical protein